MIDWVRLGGVSWERIGDVIAEPGAIIDGPFGSNLKGDHYQAEGVRVIRLGNIGVGQFINLDQAYVTEDHFQSLSRHAATAGDVVVAALGNGARPAGRACLVPDELTTAMVKADCFRIRPNARLDGRYLMYFLNSPQVLEAVASSSRGATRPRMTLAILKSIEVPVRAVADQRTIAAELDRQIANVDAAYAGVEVRSARANDLRIRLLRDFLPLPPQGPWPWVGLDAVAEFLDGRRRPVSASERALRTRGVEPSELVPYYGANGQTGWIDDYLFEEPLVLLAEDGGAFGSPTAPIAYRIDGKSWVNNHAHVLRPRTGVDVDFLGFALSVRPDIGEVISGSTRGKLNKSVAAAIQVPLPPFDVQIRIAAGLRGRLASLAEMRASIQAEREAIEALPAALLHRAFDGLAA